MKVLSIDIETAPNLAYVWSLWDQNVGLNQLVDTSEVLCFAARFVGQRRMHFHSTHADGKQAMIEAAWALLDEADVVMTYNGQSFDVPHLNREFLLAGLGPPSPFQQIDLYRVVRSRFKFASNKLAHVSVALGLDGKADTGGFDLWRRCMAGDPKAWRIMERYNRRDVVVLEELYEHLRPWVPSHPSVTLHDGTEGCPSCGAGMAVLVKRGTRKTRVSSFQRYQCGACGSYSHSGKRVGSVDLRPAA